jgi:uncharacterized protein YbjT (DUF2867 family)
LLYTLLKMNKTAVVFGATGLVGKELVSELLKNDAYHKIIAVVRKTLPVSDLRLEQVQLAGFSQLMQFHEKLKADTYFCCIGTTIKTAGSKEAFRQIDFDIPVKIAQLAEKNSVINLVVISSIGASKDSSNFYLQTKGEMENAVRAAYTGNLKIVRPSLLMGNREEFRFGEKAATAFMKIFGWLFFGPLQKYKGIYARDVARAMISVTHTPAGKMFFESDELQGKAVQYV